MQTLLTLDTLRRIARDPLATVDVWGPIAVPALALVLLLAARQYLGRWPDLWRFRRRVLPIADRLADGDYDEQLDVVDERVGVDLEAVADALPEKTGVPLQQFSVIRLSLLICLCETNPLDTEERIGPLRGSFLSYYHEPDYFYW
ncbi:hypothetical protein ACFQMF_01595 [Halorubrum rutilum]|uniref:Uncharacterized protein n=1 Tax=Halorubrum rutilum TaxID=1364933 RepID=A0ABD6AG99_9EURY|nr:hypothetical protein [Halorubrum rutilum]